MDRSDIHQAIPILVIMKTVNQMARANTITIMVQYILVILGMEKDMVKDYGKEPPQVYVISMKVNIRMI